MKKNANNMEELEAMLKTLQPRSPSPEVKSLILEIHKQSKASKCGEIEVDNDTAQISSVPFLRLFQISSAFVAAIWLCSLFVLKPLVKNEFTFSLGRAKYELSPATLSNQNLITYCVGSINNEHNILTTPLFKWTNFVISN